MTWTAVVKTGEMDFEAFKYRLPRIATGCKFENMIDSLSYTQLKQLRN